MSFAALAIVYQVTGNEGAHEMKFVLFCIITFALNFGPNVGTYVLPTACYPVHVRGTFHGLSAACAKVGAMVGTFMYKPISDRYGFATVLWVQVVLSIMGAAVSYFCLADDCKPQSVSLFDVQDTEPFLRFSKSKKSEPPGMQNGQSVISACFYDITSTVALITAKLHLVPQAKIMRFTSHYIKVSAKMYNFSVFFYRLFFSKNPLGDALCQVVQGQITRTTHSR